VSAANSSLAQLENPPTRPETTPKRTRRVFSAADKLRIVHRRSKPAPGGGAAAGRFRPISVVAVVAAAAQRGGCSEGDRSSTVRGPDRRCEVGPGTRLGQGALAASPRVRPAADCRPGSPARGRTAAKGTRSLRRSEVRSTYRLSSLCAGGTGAERREPSVPVFRLRKPPDARPIQAGP
jgi:hypothetical protein